MARIIQIFAFIILLISISFYHLSSKDINLIDYCGHSFAPVINESQFCNNIIEENIITVHDSYFQRFINLISSKNVFSSHFNNTNIVLKTSSTYDHFNSVYQEFFSVFTRHLNNSGHDLVEIKTQINLHINLPLGTLLNPKLRLCPFNTDIGIFLNKIPNHNSFNANDYLNLWMVLKDNPEPLVLKILDSTFWPVPQFFGRCGRLLAVEDCGLTLTHYIGSEWLIRANITYQLLSNAMKFTFQDPDFAYYLTDVSPDNIAVSQDGIVKFIDLENIILVDKNSDGFMGQQNNHTSQHYDCPNCLIFEADEICSYPTSDHNIYAVCKEILSDSELLPGGLLHSIDMSQLLILYMFIEECLQPKTSSRFEVAEKIMLLLENYLTLEDDS